MSAFKFAILGSDRKTVVATMTIHGETLDEAKEKARRDLDMQGVRFYPIKHNDGTVTIEVSAEVEVAGVESPAELIAA